MSISSLGLRTVIYPTADLGAAKDWWASLLGLEPYFDEAFYVGFNVAGYELGLLPSASTTDGALAYWGVYDVQAAIDAAVASGATVHMPASDVGDGIITGSIRTPDGSVAGFIHNPHFTLG